MRAGGKWVREADVWGARSGSGPEPKSSLPQGQTYRTPPSQAVGVLGWKLEVELGGFARSEDKEIRAEWRSFRGYPYLTLSLFERHPHGYMARTRSFTLRSDELSKLQALLDLAKVRKPNAR